MRSSMLLAVLLIVSGTASATTLVDGSFETPNLGTGNYSYSTQPVGWTGTGALVNAQGASAWYWATPPAGQDGAQFYALQTTASIFQNHASGCCRLIRRRYVASRSRFGEVDDDRTADALHPVGSCLAARRGQARTGPDDRC